MEKYDVIVIGSGPGGYEAAAMAAADGLATLLIERDALGGTCLNRGCIPTKALCRSAQVAGDMAVASRFGIVADTAAWHTDLGVMVRRKEQILAQLREAVDMVTSKCTKVFGEARLCAPHTVEVDGRQYTAPKIIIATGSEPATLPIPGAGLCVNSDFMLSLEELPESLAVIGGGVIGMEFASIFSAFGTKVTVIEYCKEILPPFDADIAKRLRSAMKARGVTFCTSSAVTAVSEAADGLRTVTFESKGKEKSIDTAMVLMAVGRRANPPATAPGMELAMSRRGIEVDESYRTNLPGVYAIGDCNGKLMLAHTAYREAEVAVNHMLGIPDEMRYDVVPAVIYTDPEVASVGESKASAEAKGMTVKEVKLPLGVSGRYAAENQSGRGFIKLIVDTDRNRLAGCQMVGSYASEIIMTATMMVDTELPPERLKKLVFPHPTVAEGIREAIFQI